MVQCEACPNGVYIFRALCLPLPAEILSKMSMSWYPVGWKLSSYPPTWQKVSSGIPTLPVQRRCMPKFLSVSFAIRTMLQTKVGWPLGHWGHLATMAPMVMLNYRLLEALAQLAPRCTKNLHMCSSTRHWPPVCAYDCMTASTSHQPQCK